MSVSKVPFRPALEGAFAGRFYRRIRYAIANGAATKAEDFSKLAAEESNWASEDSNRSNPLQRHVYSACWLLLRDLHRVGWLLSWEKNCLFLAKPPSSCNSATPSEVALLKDSVRNAMSYARAEKIQHYLPFLERMLSPTGSGLARVSICRLIGNGQQIATDLMKARRSRSAEKRETLLAEAVKPYVQLVTEKGRCEFTGHKLADIWRFFRFTWMNPPETTPGRTLCFLIRDAARENHPVMGIFSLENAALRISCRDERLGWDPEHIIKRIANCRTETDYQREIDFLMKSIDGGISEIDTKGLCPSKMLKTPTDEEIKRLAELARAADKERMAALQQWEMKDDSSELQQSILGGASVEVELALYKRKRAESLSRLLSAKRTIQQHVHKNQIAVAARKLTQTEAGVSAIRIALFANKNQHVGTSILELNVCGAVPPYSHILGGKLAALLALSPKVVADYRERYGNRPSDIASRMKGQQVCRPAELVFVGTTSLYGSGTSQYNRLKIPREIFGSPEDVVWERLGVTEGYGTLHIAPKTLQALERVVLAKEGALRSNHMFGEGASPKLRSIRNGIESILEPKQRGTVDIVGKHEMRRLVFGAKLAMNCEEVLSNLETMPKYYFNRTRNVEAGTQRIIDFWKSRWLDSRINYLPALNSLCDFDADSWLAECFSAIDPDLDLKSSRAMAQEV